MKCFLKVLYMNTRYAIHFKWEYYTMPMNRGRLTELIGNTKSNLIAFL